MGCAKSKVDNLPPETTNSATNAINTNVESSVSRTRSDKEMESKLMSMDGKRGEPRPPTTPNNNKVSPSFNRSRSQMTMGDGVKPMGPIRARSRPGLMAHMSRKKLVKSLLLMTFKNAASEGDNGSKLDHVTFRSMYREITSIGGRRQPSASMIRHLMIFLDKKHDPSMIMEFEIVGSFMRAVELILSGDDNDGLIPDLLMHAAQCLVQRAELMAVLLHDLFMKFADPSQTPPCIDTGGMYKLLKGVFKNINLEREKAEEEEEKLRNRNNDGNDEGNDEGNEEGNEEKNEGIFKLDDSTNSLQDSAEQKDGEKAAADAIVGVVKLKKKLKKVRSKKKVKKPSRDETKVFMTFMDQDGDGVVNEREFISYMCVGMCMTKKRRKKFKKKSPMHKKLVKFLTAVGTKLEQDVDEAEASRKAMDPEVLSVILSYGAG